MRCIMIPTAEKYNEKSKKYTKAIQMKKDKKMGTLFLALLTMIMSRNVKFLIRQERVFRNYLFYYDDPAENYFLG